ncbi:histidine kinase [Pseudoxanthomonas sp.]|uniref:sensor histidine kinase n=1 Tax=Pseudoxanthomonas sp. TaxID=1871049 RepID=UPI00258B887D|nr:histidine kinase [Pseudoxanthomonas sp.]MCR6686670.1 histidine kinase [Pseudoxanthomonas sp.]
MPPTLPRWLKPAPDSLLACALRRGRPAWSEAIHVLWTLWVFVLPLFTPQGYDLRWALLTLLSYPLFLALYACVLMVPLRWVWVVALAMCALSMALQPWYPSGMNYFIFGCVFLGAGRSSIWRYLSWLVLLSAVFFAYARWMGCPWSAIAWLLPTVLITGVLVRAQRATAQRDAALLLSQEEVRRLAATAERERIGRDLHDLLGHTLSLVALKADLAGKLLQRDPAAAGREIGELGQVARDALAQVRRAVTGIRAAGLAAELAAARLLLESDGVALQAELEEAALAPEHETVLALCLREAATNIQRHARARRVRVELVRAGERWRLVVEDDGRGGAIRPGNGLDGMRERLRALGGSLRFEPAGARGTRLVAELPHWHAPAPVLQPV